MSAVKLAIDNKVTIPHLWLTAIIIFELMSGSNVRVAYIYADCIYNKYCTIIISF